jgi:hypothetical protein
MKALIVHCLKEMFDEKYDPDVYAEACKVASIENKHYLNNQDIEDEKVITLFTSLAKHMYIDIKVLFDAFGEYFICTFAQKYFKNYFRIYKSTKDFLKAIDKIHVNIESMYGGSTPPRFDIEEKDNKLIIHYKSGRNLIDLLISLVKGVSKYYKEKIYVNKINDKTIEIKF